MSKNTFYENLIPVRNGIVNKAKEYIYSSAGAYMGQESLVEVELIELDNTIGYIDS